MLSDIVDTPMLGVSPVEFQRQLDILSDADMNAVHANRQRTLAIEGFLEWVQGTKRRACSSKLREALLALTE